MLFTLSIRLINNKPSLDNVCRCPKLLRKRSMYHYHTYFQSFQFHLSRKAFERQAYRRGFGLHIHHANVITYLRCSSLEYSTPNALTSACDTSGNVATNANTVANTKLFILLPPVCAAVCRFFHIR